MERIASQGPRFQDVVLEHAERANQDTAEAYSYVPHTVGPGACSALAKQRPSASAACREPEGGVPGVSACHASVACMRGSSMQVLVT